MSDKFNHELQTRIADALIRNDANLDNIKNSLSEVSADRAEIEEWMYDLEQEFKDTAGEYLDYEISQMSLDELIEFVTKNMRETTLNERIYEQTYNTCHNIEELEKSKEFNIENVLGDIVYWCLYEVDYIEPNPYIDYILYDFSGKVFDQIASEEQKNAYYN